MQQLVPGGGGVGVPGGQQLLGQLRQSGLDVPGVHVEGGLAHCQGVPQLVHVKAELPQQFLVGQQHLLLLGGQAAQDGGEEGLGHGVIALGLHAVKVHPLVGGVLVDEEHPVPLLHHDVGVQHLAHHAPGEVFGGLGLLGFGRRAAGDSGPYRSFGFFRL